jgi:uncharacterized protein (DUF4213/DUF364 family)
MGILDDLISTLPDLEVLQVCIGLHWTGVVVESDGVRRCGLASTLHAKEHHHGIPDVPQSGQLANMSGLTLARFAQSELPTLASVGVAAINALIPPQPELWVDMNAEEVIAEKGAGKSVVLIGEFPFVPRLRQRVGELIVLERDPEKGDLPDTAAPAVIPTAEVVAITGMTLINHTLESLLDLCSPRALMILIGPSVPLSPLLFDYGFDLLCGSVVTAIDPVLQVICQAGNFRQMHRAGVRLVTVTKPGFNENAGGSL